MNERITNATFDQILTNNQYLIFYATTWQPHSLAMITVYVT